MLNLRVCSKNITKKILYRVFSATGWDFICKTSLEIRRNVVRQDQMALSTLYLFMLLLYIFVY